MVILWIRLGNGRASERGSQTQVSVMIEHLTNQLRVLGEKLSTRGPLDADEAQAKSVANDAAEAVASKQNAPTLSRPWPIVSRHGQAWV